MYKNISEGCNIVVDGGRSPRPLPPVVSETRLVIVDYEHCHCDVVLNFIGQYLQCLSHTQSLIEGFVEGVTDLAWGTR